MSKELLQHTWWALVRGSRGLPGGHRGPRHHSLGSTALDRRSVAVQSVAYVK